MSEPSCGASVQAIAIRVASLDQNGVPLPGAGNLYTSDALTSLEADPVFTKGADIEKLNAAGKLCVNYKQRDVLRRYDLTLEICSLDPELEPMMVGGLQFSSLGVHVGASAPKTGVVEKPYGVSVELWSRHIVDGDMDATWPYIWWVLPRSYWQPGKIVFNSDAMPRPITGFTSENPNWFNGPTNDWQFDSTRSIAWQFTKTIPNVTCGAVTLAAT